MNIPGERMPELATIGQNDRDMAADIKQRVRNALELAAKVMDEANRSGMRVQFHFGVDGFGRNVVAALDVVKVL
jgi:hypothetical protein